jgi:hypothetical protein
MLLNEYYHLTLGLWRNGELEGETLSIYPDGTIFYGSIKERQSVGMGCYLIPYKMAIYSFSNSKGDDLFIIDDNYRASLTIVQGNTEFRDKLKGRGDYNDYIKL